jgi:biopolymer transport protein ExbB/TolQ
MIMLAAVAASGDVNVNAIAACAAVAVAGVGLAVPCLFGHNSLNTRVKELTQLGRVSCEIVK